MLNVLSFSEPGGHRVNQDAFAVQQHPLDPDLWLCFVADGQGGQPGGGPAAQLACHTALAAASRCAPLRLHDRLTWPSIVRQADEAVARDATAGFTTLVALCVASRRVLGASNGDSGALLIGGDRHVELTSDQRKQPPVGSGAADAVPFSAALSAPWQLLAMSDGVWKFVGWDGVIEAARRARGQALIEELQSSARLPGSGQFQDDFTIVVLDNAV
jgi:serine/threonine protein phosphatase PrpC